MVGMKEEEVDEVVLVGGTTRIPRIKWQLRLVVIMRKSRFALIF